MIQDVKFSKLGVDSDHSAVLINIDLKIKRAMRKTEKTILSYQMLQDNKIKEEYNGRIKEILTKNQRHDWRSLAQTIKKASEEIIGVTTTNLSGWLEPSK